MPTLQEILAEFPDRPFAMNDKDADEEAIELLSRVLMTYPESDRSRFYYIGEAAALVRKKIPGVQVAASAAEAKQCLKWWLALSWSGYVPASCRHTILAMPVRYARKLKFILPKLIADLHRGYSQVWIFDASSEEDARFARAYDLDVIGTYRLDRTIRVLKEAASFLWAKQAAQEKSENLP